MRVRVAALRGVVAALGIAAVALATGRVAAQGPPVIGLITKTETNPFFVKMKEGATEAANAQGRQAADRRRQGRRRQRGPGHGDREHDGRRREDDPDHAERHQGHRAGDQEGAREGRDGDRAGQPDRPADATDALFATDNYKAGVLIGQYAKAAMGGKPAQDRDARPVPRPPGGRAAPQRLHEGLRPGRARRQEQRTRPRPRDRLHGRQLRRPGQGPDGDGELPAEERPTSTSSTRSTSPPPPVPTRR